MYSIEKFYKKYIPLIFRLDQVYSNLELHYSTDLSIPTLEPKNRSIEL